MEEILNKGPDGINCRMCESETNVKMREIEGDTKQKVTIYLCDNCVKRLSIVEGLVKG